ncbi:MAG: DNA recombination protein RmuC [Candidatus Kerfeldbacteria bacterium]|nr:DNA recombination protein RmuC [Candidatus Kerfeldbacteria bacterium]
MIWQWFSLAVIFSGAVVVLYVLIDRRLRHYLNAPKDDTSLTLLNQNIQGMQQRLDQVSHGLNNRLDNAARVIADVSKELGQVQELGRGMKDLQSFLKSPKLRGNIGEQVLRDLLSQHFPQSFFEMQYKFGSGEIVDAVLKTDNGLIGIDSKFPLENFDEMMLADTSAAADDAKKLFFRDVKKHITDVARKYIVPEAGTVNFAVLYVPSEAVYYEIIRDVTDLTGYAYERKVLLVSPNSFFYFLKVIMIGMQGKKIEEQAQRILMSLEGMTKDAQKVGDALGVLTTHVTNTKGALDRVTTEYSKLAGKIDQIKLLQ